ncbi:MAG: hypothetical protein CMF43_05830 [Legionellales bacterium]|nr:hypothetical protein [Legionellales bacterium]
MPRGKQGKGKKGKGSKPSHNPHSTPVVSQQKDDGTLITVSKNSALSPKKNASSAHLNPPYDDFWSDALSDLRHDMWQDPYRLDVVGKTLWQTIALSYGTDGNPLSEAMVARIESAIQKCGKDHPSLINDTNELGYSPVGEAICAANLPGTLHLMTMDCVLEESVPEGRWLHEVVRYLAPIDMNFVQQLLPQYVHMNSPDAAGKTLLGIALQHHKNVSLALSLLEYGADPNICYQHHEFVLENAMLLYEEAALKKHDIQSHRRSQHMHHATLLVCQLLQRLSPEHINSCCFSDQRNALMTAAVWGETGLVQLILRQHPDCHAVDDHNQTVLHHMAYVPNTMFTTRHQEIVLLLSESGLNFLTQNTGGNTAAMLACQLGNGLIAGCLADDLSDHIYMKNNRGEFLLFLAIQCGDNRLCEKILQSDAFKENPPFSLLESTCPVSPALVKAITAANGREIRTASAITSIALCLLLWKRLAAPGTLFIMLMRLRFSEAPVQEDLYQIVLNVGSVEALSMLASYGVEMHEKHQGHLARITRALAQPLQLIPEYFEIINKVNQSLSVEKDASALVKNQGLSLDYFPMTWVNNRPDLFADYFLLLCLESPHFISKCARLSECVTLSKVSLFSPLDDQKSQFSVLFRSAIRMMISQIELKKITERCHETDRAFFKERGIHENAHAKAIDAYTQSPSYSDEISAKIPPFSLQNDYAKAAEFWQEQLAVIYDNHQDMQPSSPKMTLMGLFVGIVDRHITDILIEGVAQPDGFVYALRVLHQCQDVDIRERILAAINQIFDSTQDKRSLTGMIGALMQQATSRISRNELSTKQTAVVPADNNTSIETQSDCSSAVDLASVPQDTQEISSAPDNTRQFVLPKSSKTPISLDGIFDLLCAYILHLKSHDQSGSSDKQLLDSTAPEWMRQQSQSFYFVLMKDLFQPSHILSKPGYIQSWLELGVTSGWFNCPEHQLQVLIYCAWLSSVPDLIDQSDELFKVILPVIKPEIVLETAVHPMVLRYLTGNTRMEMVRTHSTPLFQILYSYTQFHIIISAREKHAQKNDQDLVISGYNFNIKHLQDQIEEMRQILEDDQAGNRSYEATVSDLEAKNTKLTKENQTLQSTIAHKTEQLESQSQCEQNQKDRIQSLEIELEKSRSQAHSLDKQIQLQNSSHTYSENEWREKLKTLNDTITQQRNELNSNEQLQVQQLDQHKNDQARIQALESQLCSLQTIHAQNLETQSAAKTLFEQQEITLKQRVVELEQDNTLLKQKASETETKHNAAVTDIEARVAHFEQSARDAKTNNTKQQRELRALLNEYGCDPHLSITATVKRLLKTQEQYESVATSHKKQASPASPSEYDPRFFTAPSIPDRIKKSGLDFLFDGLYVVVNAISACREVKSIYLSGSIALAMARSEIGGAEMLYQLLYQLGEDIDLTLEPSYSSPEVSSLASKLRPLLLGFHFEYDSQSLFITNLQSGWRFHILLRQLKDCPPYPDAIHWRWMPRDLTWALDQSKLKTAQRQFVLFEQPTLTETVNYSFYWSLHQHIKHAALSRPTTATFTLLLAALSKVRARHKVARSVCDILKKFHRTAYWNETVLLLLYGYDYGNGMGSLAHFLLPDGAKLPRNHILLTAETHNLSNFRKFMSYVKSQWALYEDNRLLLDKATSSVNWSEYPTGVDRNDMMGNGAQAQLYPINLGQKLK